MNKTQLLKNVNTKINKMKMSGRKHSPEILLILGIAGVVTGTALACVATTKVPTVKKKVQDELEVIHEELDTEEDTNLAEIKKQSTAVVLKGGVRTAALYAPAVVVTGLSLSCLVISNVILRKRLIGVSAAYGALATSFKEYRGRVTDRYGSEIEHEIRYNIQQKEIETTSVDAKGKTKTKTEKIKAIDPSTVSDFTRIWDVGNPGWTKDPQTNLAFLKCQERAANDKLKRQGFLFLNDVYEMLGFPKCAEGQVAGWIFDEKTPVGDNFVDFGILNINAAANRDFVNGYERSILLDFNIDGDILPFI